MISEGLPEWQADWFIAKGYDWCVYLMEAIYGPRV